MTRHALVFGSTLGLLASAGVLLLLPRDAEEIRLATPLDTLPISLGGWSGSNHVPTDVLPVDPQVPVHLLRSYQNGPQTVWVSVGYYPLQAAGRRPPAQELLYPGRGWSELSARSVRIPVDPERGRSIPANLLLMRTGGRQVAMLYWYQIQGRSVASDHWYRALLLYTRLVHRRADGALVRIASPVPDAVDPAAVVATQARFIQAFYPELVRSLPQ